MAVSYKELGLVNTKDMFKKAMAGGYAVPAYNFNNMEQLQGIIMGCVESKSPVVLQVSGSARKYADPTFLPYMAMGAVQMAKALGAGIPIALHLDHGSSFELAISIGTSHGAYKFKVKPGEEVPPLRFDILDEVSKRVPGFPIVLHGASSVEPAYVEMINAFGGKMDDAVGIPAEQLRRAAQSAVCKINIDSDGRLAITAMIRKVFAENPSEFDPRKYLGPARDELIEMVKRKNEQVLGSAGQA